MATGLCEVFGILKAIEQIRQEQPAEEKHFLSEERPHAQFDRVVLLLSVVEMMRDDAAGVTVVVSMPGIG